MLLEIASVYRVISEASKLYQYQELPQNLEEKSYILPLPNHHLERHSSHLIDVIETS